MTEPARTKGEILFEQYLETQGLPFEFEKQYLGKSKRPDYSIEWKGVPVVFDVKDYQRVRCCAGKPVKTSFPTPRNSLKPGIAVTGEVDSFTGLNCCSSRFRSRPPPVLRLETG